MEADPYRGHVPATPPAFEQHLITGGAHLREGRVEAAQHEFEQALALVAGHPKALGLLGLVHFRQADFESALPVYEQLVKVDPEDASNWLNLGLVHLKLGDATRAIEELTRSRDLDPSQTRTVSYLGLACARNGNYALAYESFLQAGQADLAQEMAQHLSDDECEAIVSRVSSAAAKTRESGPTEQGAQPSTEPVAVPPPTPSQVSENASGPAGEPMAAEAPPTGELLAEGAPSTGELVEDAPPDEQNEDVAGMFEVDTSAGTNVVPSDGTPEGDEDDRGAVSRAVAIASPSAAAEAAATRTASGHRPPQPVSEFATNQLVRPEDGENRFEISAGGLLVIRAGGRIIGRRDGVIVEGGGLSFEVQKRRVRGAPSEETLGGKKHPLYRIAGNGHMIVSPGKAHFAALVLDSDILYLREDLVYAFDEDLSWESGQVPGSHAKIPIIQFRGQGAVAFKSNEPLVSVKLSKRVVNVDATVLAGWIGRVIPRIVKNRAPITDDDRLTIECSGEGVVLISDQLGLTTYN